MTAEQFLRKRAKIGLTQTLNRDNSGFFTHYSVNFDRKIFTGKKLADIYTNIAIEHAKGIVANKYPKAMLGMYNDNFFIEDGFNFFIARTKIGKPKYSKNIKMAWINAALQVEKENEL
jgi:hypothetical protein